MLIMIKQPGNNGGVDAHPHTFRVNLQIQGARCYTRVTRVEERVHIFDYTPLLATRQASNACLTALTLICRLACGERLVRARLQEGRDVLMAPFASKVERRPIPRISSVRVRARIKKFSTCLDVPKVGGIVQRWPFVWTGEEGRGSKVGRRASACTHIRYLSQTNWRVARAPMLDHAGKGKSAGRGCGRKEQ